ncbi:MAG: hypothetical protein NWF05_00840 [Candidatus Bathyarchaeota archaeon]|nr:hypothetical protein [Candidatus Bathyarchaeota archaeon]
MSELTKKYSTNEELTKKYCKDKYCKIIFKKLLSNLETETHSTHRYKYKKHFKYNELVKLTETEMSEPTLRKHLKHLQEKGVITKKVKTAYHTSYRFNIELDLLIEIMRKGILSKKEKHMLVTPDKLKKGDEILTPMYPIK